MVQRIQPFNPLLQFVSLQGSTPSLSEDEPNILPLVPFHLKQLFECIPKTELHLHIGGSTRKEDIEVFMRENNTPESEIPKFLKLIKPRYESITDILDAYYKIPKHVYTPSQFKRATSHIVQDVADENVKVLEVRTSILNKGGEPSEIVNAVEEGLQEGTRLVKEKKGYEISTYLTILAQRYVSSSESVQTAKLAIELSDRPNSMVSGFDLAGDESKHSIKRHVEALKYVKEHGLSRGIGLTVHAGETKVSEDITGAESIRIALDCGADRISHAIRLIDDDELREFVIRNQIPIEMTPWSHVQIQAVESYKAHPIRQFLDEGMNINLSTDNRLMSQITLSRQLCQLWLNKLITSWDELRTIILGGIKAAFLPELTKVNILANTKKEFDLLEKRFWKTIKKYLSGDEDKFPRAA